jgi:hypothetical protein
VQVAIHSKSSDEPYGRVRSASVSLIFTNQKREIVILGKQGMIMWATRGAGLGSAQVLSQLPYSHYRRTTGLRVFGECSFFFYCKRRCLQKSKIHPRSRIFHNPTRVLNMRHSTFYPGPVSRLPSTCPNTISHTRLLSLRRSITICCSAHYLSASFPSPQSDHPSHSRPAATPSSSSDFF